MFARAERPDNYKPVTVLIVDDEKMIRDLLGDTLSALGYRTETAENFAVAIERLEKSNIDVVITDIMMPDKSGVDLTRFIKGKYQQIPVLAISGKGVPESDILEAGADGFLAKPFRIGVVEDLIIKTLLKYDINKIKPVPVRKRILVVDDEPSIVSTMIDSLDALGYESVGVRSSSEAIKALKNDQFDLVLTDIRMPEKSGIELMHEIKASHPDLPVVIITGYPVAYPPEKAIAEGADGYIAKPFRLNQIDSLLAKLFYNYETSHD
jgi:two-component system sensor histidine kinase/response regulator